MGLSPPVAVLAPAPLLEGSWALAFAMESVVLSTGADILDFGLWLNLDDESYGWQRVLERYEVAACLLGT